MAYTAKEYQGGAAATTLASDITSGSMSIVATAATAYPTGSGGNFVIVLGAGSSTEEKILCSSRTTNTFTVAASGRGYDNTSAVSHTAGATLAHVLTATDLQEANTAVVQTIGKVTTAGDLLVASGPNAFSRLPIGTAGQVATVSGGTVAWATPAAPSLSYQTASPAADVTLTVGVKTQVTSITLAAGTWFITGVACCGNGVQPGTPISVWLERNDSVTAIGAGGFVTAGTSTSDYGASVTAVAVVVLAGSTTIGLFAQTSQTGSTVFKLNSYASESNLGTQITAVKIA